MFNRKGLKRLLLIGGVAGTAFYMHRHRQLLADIEGVAKSIRNTSRAAIILGQSVYDYTYELGAIEYNTEQYHEKRSEIHYRVARRILKLSEQNKGIYLKLGQYLGNLERVVPREFTEVLRVLQDSAPSLPFEQIRVVVDQDLSRPMQEVYSQFDREAIAAASLAQVHRARLLTGEQVAVKIQFPFLRKETAIDLVILQKITTFCNRLLEKNNYRQLDLVKLFKTWTSTLVQVFLIIMKELNFMHEIDNAQRTKLLFADQADIVHIPTYYRQHSSERLITMEFIRGVKINDKQQVKLLGLEPTVVANNLVHIFGQMIFRFGHVHCDAHPGNILVRRTPDGKPQIVLLDHGLYREISIDFRRNFSRLWLSLISFDKNQTELAALTLNIHKHMEFLPLIFLYRTKDSTKKLGAPITPEQRKYLRERDIANFESVNRLLQDLPPDLMFIIRASNLVSMHNTTLGGDSRNRLFYYTHLAMQTYHSGWWRRAIAYCFLVLRITLFENAHWLFRLLYT